MQQLNKKTSSLYIAHRGHGYYENTEQSFEHSKNYYGIECDIRVTKDEKFVINHDAVIKFDDGSVLEIVNATYKELVSKTVAGKYKICTLEHYLHICKTLQKQAIIEIKPKLTTNQIVLMLAIITEHYSQEQCVIISFNKENLLNFKKLSTMELMCLFDVGKEGNINFCIENKINPSIYYVLIKKEDVEKVHSCGLKMGAWTVNNIFANIRMKKLKVDYITSDKFWT
jgi:glycerophosphoryl diester phosphodiesterase